MRSKFKWIYALLIAFTMQFSFAQEKTITGTVSDAQGSLPGANVLVKGSQRTVSTGFDGGYSIKAKVGDVLVFSFLGMTNSSRTVGSENVINVKMEEATKTLVEVVVQGYGKSAKKAKVSSAISTVTSTTIEDRPNLNFLQTIQGQAAGVAIAFNSGTPGSNKVNVIIRGESSLNGSVDPLYVIDGMPLNQSFFRNLNPNDIENVSILKDAAATSIYGNRGANGVIVISTKKGKYNSAFSVDYSSLYGAATLPKDKYNLTNGKELLAFQRSEVRALGLTSFGSGLTQAAFDSWTIDTNWKDVFYRTATSNQQNLSMTSGGEKMNNYTSFGYLQQDGLLANTDFKRFTFRTNFNGKSLNDRFVYSTNLNINFSKRRQVEQETRVAIGNNIVQNPVNGYLKSPGYLDDAFYQNGQQIHNTYGANVSAAIPYILIDLLKGNNLPNFFNEVKIFANTDMSYKLTKNLTYGFNMGIDYQDDKRVFANGPDSYLSIVRNSGLATPLQFKGQETQTNVVEFSANFVNRLNFNKVFSDKHTIDVTLFSEYFKGHRRVNQLQNNGLNPSTWVPGAGTGWVPQVVNVNSGGQFTNTINFAKVVSAFTANAGLFSVFATADYDYDSLFGVSGSIRRDGSYKFTGDNRWGTFWSASGRFNLNNLEVINRTNIFSELKLRGSYGTTGNQNVVTRDVDATVSPVFLGSQLIRDLNSSQNGYQGVSSFGVQNIAVPELRWETTAQFNVGLDFNFKNRISGSFDIYKKNTTDLFLSQPVSAVTSTYNLNGNGGELENRGIELSLRAKIFRDSNFKLDVYANGAKNRNEIIALPLAAGATFIPVSTTNAHHVGGPSSQYFVVPYLGVNQATGQLMFLDINGNVTTNPTANDRRTTGKNRLPVYQGGFGFDMSYAGFYVNTLFTYAQDFTKFDDELEGLSDPTTGQFSPVTKDLDNAWTPTNTNTDVPSNAAAFAQANAIPISDRFLLDASFIRLKSSSIGYSVPQKFLKDIAIRGFKVYVQAENLVTWTKWRGLDPENFDSDGQGKYPNSKSISFGIDVQF